MPLRRYLSVTADEDNLISHGQPKGPKNGEGFQWTRARTKSTSTQMRRRQAPSRCGQVNKNPRAGASGPGDRGDAQDMPRVVRQSHYTITRGSVRPMGAKYKTKSPKKQDKKVCQEVVSVNPYFYISSGASSKPLAQRKRKPVIPSKIIHEEKVKKRLWCLMREHASGEV